MNLHRLLAWCGVLLVLGAVASAYFTPEMVVDLANRVWSCF
jgi:hypothetical protein